VGPVASCGHDREHRLHHVRQRRPRAAGPLVGRAIRRPDHRQHGRVLPDRGGGSLPTQLAFQRVEDPTPGKNKLHLDVHTDGDLDAEVARWTAAGATSLGKRNAGDFYWVTLTDPDGNEFCIAGG
jgi:Glyoxalase-like domain